jgi:selenocysteine lyase/cysteine desulfurase
VDVAQFRSLFPIARTRAYLFNGALTPAAVPVSEVWRRWASDWTSDPLYRYNSYYEELPRLREALARLLGVPPLGVGFVHNTSQASNLIVHLLCERPGTNVVVDDTTYPSGLYPWLSLTSLEVRYVATDGVRDAASALGKAIDSGTVAVSVTHVGDLTGRRHDLASIATVARRQGALLIADVAQSAGVVPLDGIAAQADFLAGTTMKWLLGPPGVGFVYVRPELLDELPPRYVGYEGARVPWENWPQVTLPAFLPGAQRFELGLPSLPGIEAARVGMELIMDVGVDRVFEQVEGLVGYLLDALTEREYPIRTPRDPACRAGVVAFEHPRAEQAVASLRVRGVDIGSYPFGLVRVDPHGYNNLEDIDRLLEELDRFDQQSG